MSSKSNSQTKSKTKSKSLSKTKSKSLSKSLSIRKSLKQSENSKSRKSSKGSKDSKNSKNSKTLKKSKNSKNSKNSKDTTKSVSLDCSICLEPIDKLKNDFILTHCGHYFHKKCLENACEVKETCPYCRADIQKECDELTALTDDQIIDIFNRSASWSGERQAMFERWSLLLVKQPDFNPNLETLSGSLLHTAYKSKNMTVFEALLKHPDIDVEKEDYRGRTVMNLVIADNNEYVYKLFKKHKKLHKKYKGLM